MRVIITGGTGLIGRALAADLLKDQHEVIVLSRSPAREPAGVRVAGWDARTAQGWGTLAEGADAIVNLAGANLSSRRWTGARKHVILESRTNAGAAVAEAVEAARVKPGVVVQASAVGYYGPRGDEVVTEDKPPGDDFVSRVCLQWEAATAPVEALGVRRAVVRLGVVLSTEGGALPLMMLPFKLFAGGRLGSGRQWLAWLHVDDAVAALRFLVESPDAAGAFNVTSPGPVTNADFNRALGRAMQRPAWMPAPAFAIRLAFGEMAKTVLTGQRVVPRRLQEAGFEFRYPEVEAALRDLVGK